jgi:hypothetical protein
MEPVKAARSKRLVLALEIGDDCFAELRTGNGRQPDRHSAIEKRIGAASRDQIALRFSPDLTSCPFSGRSEHDPTHKNGWIGQ